jgi:transcriptional regulator with XRE-family HTH domain
MKSSTKPGPRWFASWLRDRRLRAGWSRRNLVRASKRGGPGLTLPIVQDLERADRLPTWVRANALAAAFELPPWVMQEVVRLAAHVEAGWERHRGRTPPAERVELSRHLRVAGREAEAAACAEMALREADGVWLAASELALGRALIGIGFAELARWHAARVLERGRDRDHHGEALLVSAEASLAEGHGATARIFLERAEQPSLRQTPALRARVDLVRAQLALRAGRPKSAAELAMDVIDLLPRACREHRCAAQCIVSALRRQGRSEQAQRWAHRMLRELPVPPPPGVAPRRLGD